MNKEELNKLHKHSVRNQTEILKSKQCGCFFCNRIFNVKEIKDYLEENKTTEKTAICPYCGIDSVLGSACGVEITEELLNEMNEFWF